jgi:hypothetical protein
VVILGLEKSYTELKILSHLYDNLLVKMQRIKGFDDLITDVYPPASCTRRRAANRRFDHAGSWENPSVMVGTISNGRSFIFDNQTRLKFPLFFLLKHKKIQQILKIWHVEEARAD